MLIKLALMCLVCFQVAAIDPLGKYRKAATEKWEADIEQLEKLDTEEIDPEHAVLFIGSSSIRRWDSIAEDMAPWPTIRRGYGGAKLSDLAIFVERLVAPHQFDALVIFVGNDISGSDVDKTPTEVLELYQTIVRIVREIRKEQPIFFIAITPTGKRYAVWDKINQANKLIEDYCATETDLHFIATVDKYLMDDGKPNDALFVEDRLHLNQQGYRIWAALIKDSLSSIMKPK